jgi:hypothetical protein
MRICPLGWWSKGRRKGWREGWFAEWSPSRHVYGTENRSLDQVVSPTTALTMGLGRVYEMEITAFGRHK